MLNPVTRYHITTVDRLENIARHGLAPGNISAIGSAGDSLVEHKKGRGFVCAADGIPTWLSLSEGYVMRSFDRKDYRPKRTVPIVLRVRVPESALSIDQRGSTDSEALAYFLTETISPGEIEAWNGREWQPLVTAVIDFSDAFDADGYLDSNSRLRQPDLSR